MLDERIYFRTLLDSDATRLFEIYSNTEAMRFRATEPMFTIEDAYKMLKRNREVEQKAYEFRFAIIEKLSEILIGTIMYQPLHFKAIIGYSLDEKFWNKGYGTSIVEKLIDLLKIKNFQLVEAWVKKENVSSCKVLEKNHFKYISQTIYPQLRLYQRNLMYS